CQREEPSCTARDVLRVSALHLIDRVAPLEIVDEPCEQTALPLRGVRVCHLPGIEVSEEGMERPARFEAPDVQLGLQGLFVEQVDKHLLDLVRFAPTARSIGMQQILEALHGVRGELAVERLYPGEVGAKRDVELIGQFLDFALSDTMCLPAPEPAA